MTFGEKLKQVRLSMDMSQSEFADLLHTSKQVVSRYELGQNTPKIDTVSTWCKILGFNVDDMLNTDSPVLTTGYRMKLLRKESHIDVEEIANALGVSIATVYRYENGDIEKMPGALLEPLARVLKTTPAYLMGWETQGDKEILALTKQEADLIRAYREKLELQAAVDKLLLD